MPVKSVEIVPYEAVRDILNGEGIWIFPNQAAVRLAEKQLLKNSDNIIWGDRLFTPSTFIKAFSDPFKPAANPIVEKAIIIDIIGKTELKYFERVRTEIATGSAFFRTITALRKNLISSDELERDLTERGSLKEFDLLTVYKKYEERLDSLRLYDEGAGLSDIILKTDSNGELGILRSTQDDSELEIPACRQAGFGSTQDDNGIKTIIFDGFEPMPPGMAVLINKIGEKSPGMRVVTRRDRGLVREILRSTQDDNETRAQDDNEQKFRKGNKIELHTCRSVGNECRFIAATIAGLVEDGMAPEKIGIIASHRSPSLKPLIFSLRNLCLIPEHAVRCREGQNAAIKRIVRSAGSPDQIAEALQSEIASKLKQAFKEGLQTLEITANLERIKKIFENARLLKDTRSFGISDDTIKNTLFMHLSEDPKSFIDTNEIAFNWLWWDEDAAPKLDTIFIPSAHQGGIPPETSPSIFFQETSFLPANAPSYFATLFPQSDLSKSLEAKRFNRYLTNASERIVLSLSRINAEGKETCPSNVTAMLDLTEVDEAHRPYPASVNDAERNDILRRAENELKDRRRKKAVPESIITDPEIKSSIEKQFEKHIFSASQLERFAKCPYQYFLSKVIGLEPIDPPTPEINPKHRGTIIHRIMELFYRNEVENVLKFIRREIPFERLAEKMDEYIDTSLEENKELLSDTHPALVDHFKKRSRTVCISAVKKEIELINAMKFPLLPEYTEWEFGKGDVPFLAIKHEQLKTETLIRGIIDRIDVDAAHNTFSITDYKTGNTESVLSKISNGKHLQLPLYIEAARRLFLKDKKPVGAFLFSLRTLEKKHGLALKDMKSFYFPGTNPRLFVDDEKWNELVSTALKTAAVYVDRIRRSDFVEDTSDCKHLCDFKDICRYGKK